MESRTTGGQNVRVGRGRPTRQKQLLVLLGVVFVLLLVAIVLMWALSR